MTSPIARTALALVVTLALAGAARAQVGASSGIVDVNTATDAELAALPHLTPELVKSIVDARPFDGALALHQHLLAQKLSDTQTAELYAKAFVHINLNTASKEEIMLIPGAGKKMAHEFDEYRPWKTFAQFHKEIGKYVGKAETTRFAQYCFIPLNVNKASDAELNTIPKLTPAALAALTMGKPHKKLADVEAALSAAVGDKEAKRVARFLIVK